MALGKNGVAGATDHFLLGSLVSPIGTSICMPPLSSPGDSTSLTRNTELFLVLAHHHHGNGLSSSDRSAVHCTTICALIHSGARDISHFRQNQSPRSYHGGWLRRGYSRLHHAACRKAELSSIRWNVSRGCWRVSLISNLDGKSPALSNYSIIFTSTEHHLPGMAVQQPRTALRPSHGDWIRNRLCELFCLHRIFHLPY